MDTLIKKISKWNSQLILLIVLLAFSISSLVWRLISPPSKAGFCGLCLPSPMVRFDGLSGNFSIFHPESWLPKEIPDGSPSYPEAIALISSPGPSFSVKVIIARKEFPEGTLNQVASWGEANAQQKGHYSSMSLENIRINELDGLLREYHIEYDTIFGKRTLHYKELYIVKGSIGYVLTLRTYEDDWSKVDDVLQMMIESFTIK